MSQDSDSDGVLHQEEDRDRGKALMTGKNVTKAGSTSGTTTMAKSGSTSGAENMAKTGETSSKPMRDTPKTGATSRGNQR